MTREEIKNKLYYVADTIRMNADKFARGEALENEDWIKAAKEFTSCLNYLMQSHRNFDEVQQEEEHYEKLPIEPMKQFLTYPIELISSEETLEQFNAQKHRPVTLGFPDPNDCQDFAIRTAGEVTELVKTDKGYEATICVDESLVAGNRVMGALANGFKPVLNMCGNTHIDEQSGKCVFDEYTHVAVCFPNSCPKLDD